VRHLKAVVFAIALLCSGSVLAAEAISQPLLHSVWLVFCASLVLMMQPGFALLESGFSRSKNAVNVLMKNFSDCAFASIGFWAVGYGLMFGANPSGWIGTDQFLPSHGDALGSVLFQTFFAATAATIISGAVAERIRFLPYLLATFIVVVAVYPIFGSWVWGGTNESPGWLRTLGFLDSAGGSAVHAVGGFLALGGCLVLGPRYGRFGRDGSTRDIPGHSLPLASLGAFLLWIGWLGFNAGSTNADFSDLGRIVLNTHLAAAAGIVGAIGLQALQRKPILMTTVINGALGGLVSITAGAKYIDPAGALLIGLFAGAIVVLGSALLRRFQIDDVVDAVPVHGFCGIYGTLMVGLLPADRAFDWHFLGIQALGAGTAALWAFSCGWLIFTLIDKTIGIRAPTDHEQTGLDYTEHYELGYPEFMAIRTHRAVDGRASEGQS